jgi:hypothetical protein
VGVGWKTHQQRHFSGKKNNFTKTILQVQVKVIKRKKRENRALQEKRHKTKALRKNALAKKRIAEKIRQRN